MPFAPKTQGRFNPLEALVERMVSRSERDIDAGGRFGIAELLGTVEGREARQAHLHPAQYRLLVDYRDIGGFERGCDRTEKIVVIARAVGALAAHPNAAMRQDVSAHDD